MAIQSIVLFSILLIITYQLIPKLIFIIRRYIAYVRSNYTDLDHQNEESLPNMSTTSTNGTTISDVTEDIDVKHEAERVQNTSYSDLMQTDVLVLNQISKIYEGRFRAVDDISFGVKKSECFGLLGVNGA